MFTSSSSLAQCCYTHDNFEACWFPTRFVLALIIVVCFCLCPQIRPLQLGSGSVIPARLSQVDAQSLLATDKAPTVQIIDVPKKTSLISIFLARTHRWKAIEFVSGKCTSSRIFEALRLLAHINPDPSIDVGASKFESVLLSALDILRSVSGVINQLLECDFAVDLASKNDSARRVRVQPRRHWRPGAPTAAYLAATSGVNMGSLQHNPVHQQSKQIGTHLHFRCEVLELGGSNSNGYPRVTCSPTVSRNPFPPPPFLLRQVLFGGQ